MLHEHQQNAMRAYNQPSELKEISIHESRNSSNGHSKMYQPIEKPTHISLKLNQVQDTAGSYRNITSTSPRSSLKKDNGRDSYRKSPEKHDKTPAWQKMKNKNEVAFK